MDILKKLTNCKIYSTHSQADDEEAWLKARTRGIGGSDIGAICGVSPFSSARQVYLQKTGQFQDSMTPNDAAKERMRFGHLLEPVVADEYAVRTGKKLYIATATLVHKDVPWALANVDRLILDENDEPYGVLECKTTSEFMNDAWESGEILTSYIYQLNWYLWVTGLKFGAFACLVGGNKFYYYETYRNDELIKEMEEKAKNFWYNNVLKLKEPEMAAIDKDFTNALFTEVIKNSETTLDDEANELAETIFITKQKIKELTEIMEQAQNRLKDRLRETEIGYTSDYIVKWSPRTQRRVDQEALKMNYPKVYVDVIKEISFRVMTVKGVK